MEKNGGIEMKKHTHEIDNKKYNFEDHSVHSPSRMSLEDEGCPICWLIDRKGDRTFLLNYQLKEESK